MGVLGKFSTLKKVISKVKSFKQPHCGIISDLPHVRAHCFDGLKYYSRSHMASSGVTGVSGCLTCG